MNIEFLIIKNINRESLHKGHYAMNEILHNLNCQHKKLLVTALRTIVILTMFMLTTVLHAQNALQDIKVASLPNDEIQLSLEFSSAPTEPLAFTIDNPARIALDFPSTNNALASRFQEIGIGTAQSVNTAEAKGRTRVVVNLTRMEDYTTRVSGNTYILTIGSSSENVAQTIALTSSSKPSSGNSINDVDFRRGNDGTGRIIINLSNPNIPINLREQGGRIHVDFANTSLPSNLSKRWDVVDFATPVQLFETFADGADTKMIISPDASKEFEHLAYQI